MSREGLFALALTALVTFPSGARAQGADCASSKSMPLTRHCYSLRYQGSLDQLRPLLTEQQRQQCQRTAFDVCGAGSQGSGLLIHHVYQCAEELTETLGRHLLYRESHLLRNRRQTAI